MLRFGEGFFLHLMCLFVSVGGFNEWVTAEDFLLAMIGHSEDSLCRELRGSRLDLARLERAVRHGNGSLPLTDV